MATSLVGMTVVFDLDGTLVDTAPDLMGGIDILLREKGLGPVPHDLLRPLISIGSRAMLKRAYAHLNHTIDDATFEAWWLRYLDIYAANIAVHSRPFDGLVPLLDRLATRNAKLAVCTNKGEALSLRLLAAVALKDRFQGIAGRDTFPNCREDSRDRDW